jgi:hypothetical protein
LTLEDIDCDRQHAVYWGIQENLSPSKRRGS